MLIGNKNSLWSKEAISPISTLKFTIDTSLGTGASFTIPVGSGANYNVLDWGDGNSDSNLTGNATHTYATDGIYQIEISGTFPGFYFNNGGDKLKIKSIDQWGAVGWIGNQINAFKGCSNLQSFPSGNWDVILTNMGGFFWNAYAANFDYGIWNYDKDVILSVFLYAKNIDATYIDSLLIKIAATVVGTGRTQTNKSFQLYQAKRTTASNVAYNSLIADGWSFTYAITIV